MKSYLHGKKNGDGRQLIGGGSADGVEVKDVDQDVILNPVRIVDRQGREITPRIRKVEVYERGDDGNFHFKGQRMMTPDEESETHPTGGTTP